MVDAYTEPINPSPLFISPMEIPDIKDKNKKQCPFLFSRRARVTIFRHFLYDCLVQLLLLVLRCVQPYNEQEIF